MFGKAAALHKKQFDRMVQELGAEVVLRLPPAKSANADGSLQSRVLGTKAWEQDTDPLREITLRGIWTNDIRSILSYSSEAMRSLLMVSNSHDDVEAVLRIPLADALIEEEKTQGLTHFDRCRDVVYAGQAFQVVFTERTGLPPLGPYILWVGLKKTKKKEA